MTSRDWLALTIWGEARGESTAGKAAVAYVIRNRLRDGRWGNTYQSVVTAPKQFSCWNTNDPNRTALVDWMAQIERGEPIHDQALLECYIVADVVLGSERIGKATHYYAARIPAPAWAKTGELVASIGNHLFFGNVA